MIVKTWTYNIIYGVLIQVLLSMSLGRGKVWMGGAWGAGASMHAWKSLANCFSSFFPLFFFFFWGGLHCFVVVLLSVKTSQILPSRHSM